MLTDLSSATTPAQDARRAAILEAAFDAFARYGFRRTSMEDIATATGISRPALYLHFQNKQDILATLIQSYYDRTAARMRAALANGQKVKHALPAAFDAKLGPELQALMASPHGAELLDAKQALTADLAAQGDAQLAAVLAEWLRTEVAAGRASLGTFGVDADALAQTMIAALGGVAMQGLPWETMRNRARALALMFARALKD